MIVRIARFVGFAAGALGGFAVSRLINWSGEVLGVSETLVIILFVILGCAIGYLFGGILGRELARWYDHLDDRLRTIAMTDLVLGASGMTVGLIIAFLAASPLRLIEPAWVSFASTAVLTALLAYGGMRAALVKREDFSRGIARRLGAEPGEEPAAPVKIIDTSIVIDGRLPDLIKASVVEGRIIIPRFVVSELQTLADSADDLKRARGRRGLDILESMRSGAEPMAELFSVDYSETPDVDSKLLRLSQDMDGTLVTVDYNLTKVARIQGVTVINLNEVANALRPNVVAGETMHIDVVREGKEPGQGVGYLEDGTMVVVEDAAQNVGEDIDIVVSSIFQASAGRMVFAKPRADR